MMVNGREGHALSIDSETNDCWFHCQCICVSGGHI